jgi:ketosteroid isomerase-like protein
MTDAAAEIRELEDRRYKAMIDKDVATLDELFADELAYTHSNALVDTKASYLKAIDKRVFDYREAKRLEEDIVVFGDSARITGHAQLHVVAGGRDVHLNARFTILYVRQDGRWRFAAWQSTPIPA